MAEQDPKVKLRIVSKAEYAQGWDKERSHHELKELEVSVRGTTLYIPVKTKSDMDESFGGPVSHIKTRTFPDFRVWIAPCGPKDPDARPLRATSDAQSCAEAGFSIPLKKLGVKVPRTRKFTFPLEQLQVEGGGIVYEMTFRNFENEKRDTGNGQVKQAPAAQPPEEA